MKKQAKNIFNILEADKTLLIKTYPQNVTNIKIGETAVFEIETESYRSSAVKYQWQRVVQDDDGNFIYEDIQGANDKRYSFVVSSENINESYRVVCTNGCSQVESIVNLTDGNISAPYNLSLTGPLSLEEQHIDAIVGAISASTNNYNSVHYYEIVNDDGKFYIDGNVLKSKVGLNYDEIGSTINITIKATNIYNLSITKTFQISLTERASNIFRNTRFYPYNIQSYGANAVCKLNVSSIDIDEWVISNAVDICSVYYWPNGNFRPGPNNYQYNREDLFIDFYASRSDVSSLGSLSQNVVLSAGKHVLYFDLSTNNVAYNINTKNLKLSVINKNSGAVVFNQILENVYVSPVVNAITVTRQRIELSVEEAGEYTVSFNSVPEMVNGNYNHGPMIGRLKLVEEVDELQEDKKIYFNEQPARMVNGSVIVSAVSTTNTNIHYMIQRTGPNVDIDDYYSSGGDFATGLSGDQVLLGLTNNIDIDTYRVIAFDDNGNATISNLFMYNDLIDETTSPPPPPPPPPGPAPGYFPSTETDTGTGTDTGTDAGTGTDTGTDTAPPPSFNFACNYGNNNTCFDGMSFCFGGCIGDSFNIVGNQSNASYLHVGVRLNSSNSWTGQNFIVVLPSQGSGSNFSEWIKGESVTVRGAVGSNSMQVDAYICEKIPKIPGDLGDREYDQLVLTCD